MNGRLLHELLEASAARSPEAPALILQDGTHVSYGALGDQSRRWAAGLRAAGLRPGDRVGLLVHNSPLYVAAFFGASMAGGVVVSLNTAADGASWAQALADCDARLLVLGPGVAAARDPAAAAAALSARCAALRGVIVPDESSGAPAASRRPRLALHGVSEIEAHEPWSGPSERSASDPAAIVYTSGSTGRPRGATLSHRNLVANAASIVDYLALDAQDRMLVILPFFYVYGKSLLTTHVMAGGSLVLENRFMFPGTALDTLERERCTGLAGVPSTFAILLHRSDFATRELADLRYVTQAGGPMSPALTRELMRAIPGKKIYVMYGATEASARLSYLAPEDLPRKVGSIGKAIPGVTLTVCRPDGSEANVDEVGELVAEGPNIMLGYWNDEAETRAVLDERGRYWTGDLARRDAEGFLSVVGRSKEMIKSGAHRIAPAEIEQAILEHAPVSEAAVVGAPDEVLGESIHAFVVFKSGEPPAIEPLREHLKQRLPGYKLPAALHVEEELPKSAAGKPLKAELAARLSGGGERAGGAGPAPSEKKPGRGGAG